MNILDKIKNAFSKPGEGYAEFENLLIRSHAETIGQNVYFSDVKINPLKEYTENVATWPDKKKVDFMVHCIRTAEIVRKRTVVWSSKNSELQQYYVRVQYVKYLLKTKIELDDTDIRELYEAIISNGPLEMSTINVWPLNTLIMQAEKSQSNKGNAASSQLVSILERIKKDVSRINNTYYDKDKLKLIEKIDGLLYHAQSGGTLVKPTRFLGEDDFSKYANDLIEQQPDAEKAVWYPLIAHAQKASGGKPTKKYVTDAQAILKGLGAEPFKRMVNDWFTFLTRYKEVPTVHNNSYGGRDYSYTTYVYLTSVNMDAIKGFIWMCAHYHDAATLRNLAALAERCYQKIPGSGPTAAALSNACFFILFTSEGFEGIAHLSRLRLRIKQSSAQNLIERYLSEAAAEKGVSLHEIEDLAVDNFGLAEGKREWEFDGYKVELVLTAVGKSELNWHKPDGAPQKTAPAFVKDKYAVEWKEIREIQKQVDQSTTTQRDRVDRMLRTDRTWTMQHFQSLYLEHGLMGFLAKKIIWNFSAGNGTQMAIYRDGHWTNNDNQVVEPASDSAVSLWHPATQTVAEIKKWRDFLVAHKIQQPLKQAYREVYLLTDAEVNTRVYSNRMAAHVLKQHQFNTLAKMRGWKYALLGCYDDGRYNEAAELKLPEYNLKAEYWVNELNADGAYNETGIWNYITTDQIRFVRLDTNAQVDLVDIPAIPFSEVLRDVDLFVGVASVGNDPTWQDSGGLPAYRDYWTSYSFGDLSEVAKNRKEILTNLVPRLKIGKVAAVKDKFLVVTGKLRTYKIHIGSTNILMEPNDQYLCIVPDRSQKNFTENLFLPFEGDVGLSIILSKAFLLAEDDKITDGTITSQIRWK